MKQCSPDVCSWPSFSMFNVLPYLAVELLSTTDKEGSGEMERQVYVDIDG